MLTCSLFKHVVIVALAVPSLPPQACSPPSHQRWPPEVGPTDLLVSRVLGTDLALHQELPLSEWDLGSLASKGVTFAHRSSQLPPRHPTVLRMSGFAHVSTLKPLVLCSDLVQLRFTNQFHSAH